MKLKMNCGISSHTQSSNVIEDELNKIKLAIDNNIDYVSCISIYKPLIIEFWKRVAKLDYKNSIVCGVPLYESVIFNESILGVIKRYVEEYNVKIITLHMTKMDTIKKAIANNFVINSRGGTFLVELMNRNIRDNPIESEFEAIMLYCKEHNIKIHLGTCLRPGQIDFCPEINPLILEDLKTSRYYYDKLINAGIYSEIECMGHVAPIQFSSYKHYLGDRCVCSMGPLITDSINGYDDINAMFGWHLAKDVGINITTSCMITRSEHIKIPTLEDDLDAIKKWQIYLYLYNLTHNNENTNDAKIKEYNVISKKSRQYTQCSAHINIFGEMNTPIHCNICGDHCPLEMKKKGLI